MPTKKNIAEEIIYNAVEAGTYDPRFDPITASELGSLTCKVDVLSDLEDVKDYKTELDPVKYGVFVTAPGGRSGLLLPDLEGVDTLEQQLFIACQKGGIDPRKDTLTIYRFTVDRFEED